MNRDPFSIRFFASRTRNTEHSSSTKELFCLSGAEVGLNARFTDNSGNYLSQLVAFSGAT